MRPEPSLAVPFIWTLAIGSKLHRFYHERSIGDCFRSQASCLGKMLVISCQTEEITLGSARKVRVRLAKVRNCVARIYPAFFDPKVLLCLCVVMKRNSSGSGERHQPECVPRREAEWARPDPGLVMTNIFEELSEMSYAADYGLGEWLLLVVRGLVG